MFNWEKYGIEGADSSIVGDCQTQVNVYKSCTLLLVIDLKNVMILPENVITTTESTIHKQIKFKVNSISCNKKEKSTVCIHTAMIQFTNRLLSVTWVLL